MELEKNYRKSKIRLNLKYISRMALDKNYRKSRIRLNLKYIPNQGWNQIKIIENQGLN